MIMPSTITPTIIKSQKQGLRIPPKLIKPFLNGSFLAKFIVFPLEHKIIIEPMETLKNQQLKIERLKAVKIMDSFRKKAVSFSSAFDTTKELRKWRYEYLSA